MITVRRATEQDRADIARIHELSIRTAGLRAYRPEEVDSWAAHITPQQYRIEQWMFVAEDAGAVIGFAHYHDGEVCSIYVDPARHGGGAGRLLMARIEETARAENAPRLVLNAALNSVGFYESCGFAVTGELSYHTRGGLDMRCLRMEKPLSPTA